MKINQLLTESQMTCSECGGPAFSDLLLAEKKDACYNKVRSRYKVWPSAYASGALVQCRKKGAANWGNKSKNEGVAEGSEQQWVVTVGTKTGGTSHTMIFSGTKEQAIKKAVARFGTSKNPVVTAKLKQQGVAEGLNEFAQGDFNGGDDSNDLQLYLNVAKKLNMKKYKPSTAHDLIAKKMAELVDAVDDEKVDWARHMARKAQGLPSMLDQQGVAEGMLDNPGQEDSPVAQAIIRRILMQRTDLLAKYGPERVGAAVDEVADFVGDVEEIGSSDVSGWVQHVERTLNNMNEDYNPEYDDEAGMADNNLETLQRAVKGIDDLIDSGDNLPEWCQEKIANAKSMLVAVWDYMYSEEASDEVDAEVDAMFEAMDRLAAAMAQRTGTTVDMVWESFEAMPDHVLWATAQHQLQQLNEDWQKVNKRDKTAGMSRKAVKAYRRENPGSKLQTAVTTKPSKLKKGSKASKRRKSFCARMRGMKKSRASAKTKRNPNSPINKALRRWNC